jgi:hypothetical protein
VKDVAVIPPPQSLSVMPPNRRLLLTAPLSVSGWLMSFARRTFLHAPQQKRIALDGSGSTP